jgi:putative hydrolase of the HAD superfamily
MSELRDGRLPALVLFDLDDTLCDHDTSLRLRLRYAFQEAMAGRESVDLDDLVEASAKEAIAGTAHFAEMLRQRGIDDPAEVTRATERYVHDRFRGLQLFDESLDVVAAVSRHTQVGMITNGPSQIQRDKIRLLKIGELFPIILVSEEEGVWKPDPNIFARAVARAGVAAADAMYIGDSPEHDMAGARAAGLISVWINRREREWPGGPPPDFEITDLRQLLPLLGIA